MRAPKWGSRGSQGCGVWRGTAGPPEVSPQGSWVKAAEQWVTEQDWPAVG